MYINILIFIIVVIGIFYYFKSRDILYVKSQIDKRKYVVLKKKDAAEAADRLAYIRMNLRKLLEHLEKTRPSDQNIRSIRKRFCSECLSEGDTNSQYTSYTVEKGEKMIFCLRDKKTQELHDKNLLMYVAIHEFSHVYTINEVGHGTQFKENFQFLLDESIKIGIYKYIDFTKENISYCGLKL
jgi:hypothetical protein